MGSKIVQRGGIGARYGVQPGCTALPVGFACPLGPLLACGPMLSRSPRLRTALIALSLSGLLATLELPARATEFDFLPAGDPLEAELRILDLLDPVDRPPFAHRRLHSRPLQVFELPADSGAGRLVSRLSRERIGRWRARDLPAPGGFHGTTPRLLQRVPDEHTALEVSAGVEGRGEIEENDSRFLRGSGLHTRAAARVDRWLLFSHLVAGHYPGGQAFADPLVAGTDFIFHTEESYLAYSPEGGRWAVQFGRSRWHWGPGEEASLLLSRTSPPLTGLALRGSLPALRLDFTSLHATLGAASGEQLAAHRIEWQPLDRLRLGVSEAARYRSDGWDPLYAVGVIPYVLVQRIEDEDETDSTALLRNNELVSVDAAWRVADGTRIYGELLVDDLHSETNDNPNKLAYQLGLEGVGTVTGRRVTWGTEYTRLSRWVYTSFFGRSFAARGEPIGFPTGPDARRVRIRGALDLNVGAQLLAAVAHTERGENRIDQPFVPGVPAPDPWSFEGVVTREREVEIGGRYWPSSGVDVTVLGSWIRQEREGGDGGDNRFRASLQLRLIR